MAVLTFPTLTMLPGLVNFYLLGNTRVFASPSGRYQQRIKLGAAVRSPAIFIEALEGGVA